MGLKGQEDVVGGGVQSRDLRVAVPGRGRVSRGAPSAANLHIPAVVRRIKASRDVHALSPWNL